MAFSRCLGSLALLFVGAQGARIARKRADTSSSLKFIAGVPVLNYDAAYGGQSSLSELETKEQEWVVIVKEDTSDEQIQQLCNANRNGCKLVGHPQKGGVPFLELLGTETDLENVIRRADGVVRFVEPDQEVQMIPEIEADDVEAATWGLTRIGADYRSVTGVGSTVFILDTGVRVTHQEFGGRAASALDMSVGGVECNGDLNCARDNQGHGTHCAGTAAGTIYGVAPGASVRSIKVLSDQGSGSWSWSYGALDWVATSSTPAAVVSMSLGGYGTQQAMKNAVDAAVAAGVTVVVAGGNSASDACNFSPAFVPSAITVGAMNRNDEASSFSNNGACVNIWAPGESVESASHTSNSGTRSLSGTSMACPHVAGGAALGYEKGYSSPYDWMHQNGLWDELSGLGPDDTNLLLYIGEH